MKRKYELKTRAQRMQETRRRIVEAAVDLHTSVGPGRTTISALAERAGVQRHTVYAHFPTDTDLFAACSAHWEGLHPAPDASVWLAIEDEGERLHTALDELYAWYESVEHDLALFRRDAVFPQFLDEDERRTAELRDVLAGGARQRVRAAIGHAVDFEAWRSLERQGLSRSQAVDMMVRLVESV